MTGSSRRLVFFAIVAALAVASCGASNPSHEGLEGFEEDEPIATAGPRKTGSSGVNVDVSAYTVGDPIKGGGGGPAAAKAETPATSGRFTPAAPTNYYVEGGCAVLIVIFFGTIFIGGRANRKIVEAWAKAFAMPGGLFHRNFSRVGAGQGVIMHESASLFKFYASGRRYCQGLLAELQLVARQDAFSIIMDVVNPAEDLIKIEVFMAEEAMPPLVLAVATPKFARALQRDAKDIEAYTKRISVGKDVFTGWPVDKLWVLGEHSSIFQDLFACDPKLQQLFNPTGPHAATLKLLRSIHFTDSNSEGSHKQVLRFVFRLPPADQMELLTRLMELVPLFIDLVGSYKMTPDLKKRAVDARTKQANEDEELRKKRLDAVQQKKMDKREEEKAKLLRMSPAERQKYEEKEKAKQYKKAVLKRSK